VRFFISFFAAISVIRIFTSFLTSVAGSGVSTGNRTVPLLVL